MLNSLKFIANHPLNASNQFQSIIRFIKWQIGSRLLPFPILYPYTQNSKLIIWRGLTGATGNLYCGLHEFEDMGFLLHFLNEDDLFVDIGANIGSYTILASGEKKATSISIEPVPGTFKFLVDNIRVNSLEHLVKSLNIGLGSERGKLNFTTSFDTVNHVQSSIDSSDVIEVEIDTLDSVLIDQYPVLLKIDVEGFEYYVLRGADKSLGKSSLKAIILELNNACINYNATEEMTHKLLLEHGFKTFRYFPLERKLLEVPSFGFSAHNTLYLRDLSFIEERIRNSPKITVHGKTF